MHQVSCVIKTEACSWIHCTCCYLRGLPCVWGSVTPLRRTYPAESLLKTDTVRQEAVGIFAFCLMHSLSFPGNLRNVRQTLTSGWCQHAFPSRWCLINIQLYRCPARQEAGNGYLQGQGKHGSLFQSTGWYCQVRLNSSCKHKE